ncbi:ROG3 (YFR022W) and ROD1 (YOR018W) [Zygosaccharomyces parabailii]|nr:ROG3 (YFR022W) and ROD1 (YOR018W) [Zygosaccharomyces parabailii]
MFPMSKSGKEPLLYDVRINGTDHDVILLKGPPEEASSVLLSGTVVLSVREPIQIKNLTLRLYGRLRMNIPVQYQSAKGPAQRYVKSERRFYEHTWDDLNIESYFENLYDNYGKRTAITSRSSGNLAEVNRRSKSSTTSLISLAGLSSSGPNHHTLVQGNYEFPFSAILPGSLVESVEGLPNASIVYKLEANIERGKFFSDLICKKHVRVVRTMRPDSLELSETMAVDNTWPKKVDYSISVPAKALAIGSLTPIHIEVVPLMKGLRLGPIKITLVENSQYCGTFGSVGSQERTVCKTKIKDPLGHVKKDPLEVTGVGEDGAAYQDCWQVDTFLQVPPSLSKCTQDCTLLNSIKVRHKIKFVISLLNADGHVSELRASLPVVLFISPFVALSVKNTEKLMHSGSSSNASSRRGSSTDDEEIIFARTASEVELAAMANGLQAPTSVPDLMSPPNYGNHIYDRLWNDISVTNTPHGSGTQTPIEGTSIGQVLDNQHSVAELEDNLRRLHLQRQGINRSASTSNVNPRNPTGQNEIVGANESSQAGPIRSLSSAQFAPSAMSRSGSTGLMEQTPSRSIPPPPLLTSGSSVPHLPRSSSSMWNLTQSPHKEWANMSNLSRVPSYDKAIRSEMIGNDLPPRYPDDEENEIRNHLERPQVVHNRSSSSVLSKLSGSPVPSPQPSQAALVRRGSNGSMSGVTPPPAHGDPPLNGAATGGKNQTASKYFSFGMTPVGSSSSMSSFGHKRSSSKGSLHEKSHSLTNLKSLLKKDRK